MLALFWKWFYINSYVYKAVLKGFQILTRDIEEKLHFMIESLHKWCKNHNFGLLLPLCANFHTTYPNKHWKTTQSCLMKMTGGGWRKLPLLWCQRPTYEQKRGNFIQPHPVIFTKQLCVVFQCLLGYIVWKLAQSGGSRSKSWFLHHLCSDSIIKCNFSSISLVKI